jgi:phospholipase C
MRRRDALKTMGGLAAVSVLPGCGGDGDGEPPPATHIFLMMENRSYDHMLGARAVEGLGGDGLTATMSNPDMDGAAVAPFVAPIEDMCVPDPPHGWEASHAQWNAGANDGFVTEHQKDHPGERGTMQFLTRVHQPVTWALADEYASCDRWFASVMGPTWPNRMYWLAGTSMGMKGNDLPPGGWTAPTIFHRLNEAGIAWTLYVSVLPWAALLGGGAPIEGHVKGIEEFYADAAAGRLPPVVYIDPPFTGGDDHPPSHPLLGQQFIGRVYEALAASPQWESSLMVVTYDEHGGFFDHVSPPAGVADDHAAEGFDQYGFRVPALVIGPRVKRGHVSSVVRDHASALRHQQVVFGLGELGARTAAAADLSELIDEAAEPRAPIVLPPVELEPWMIEAVCDNGGGSAAPPVHDILRVADEHPEWVARWDYRKNVTSGR